MCTRGVRVVARQSCAMDSATIVQLKCVQRAGSEHEEGCKTEVAIGYNRIQSEPVPLGYVQAENQGATNVPVQSGSGEEHDGWHA